MWCGTLKGVKVDFSLVCQMLLHVFSLECEDKKFLAVKKAIGKFAKMSTKWHYSEEKHKEIKNGHCGLFFSLVCSFGHFGVTWHFNTNCTGSLITISLWRLNETYGSRNQEDV
jgi:hypothetical protein